MSVLDRVNPTSCSKLFEKSLRRNESLLAEAQQIDHIGCWSWDIRSGRLDWSDELYRVFGLDRDRQSPNHEGFMAVLHPDDRAPISERIDAPCRGTKTYDCEYRVIRPDGDIRMVRARGKVIRDEAREAIEMIGTAHDITERHRAEESLRESEARSRGTFENAAVGIAHKDADGRLLRVNQRFCEIVGYPRKELVQESFQDFTHSEDRAAEIENYPRLFRGELSSYSMEKRYIRKDGSLIWIDVCRSLQCDEGGQPEYAIAML